MGPSVSVRQSFGGGGSRAEIRHFVVFLARFSGASSQCACYRFFRSFPTGLGVVNPQNRDRGQANPKPYR